MRRTLLAVGIALLVSMMLVPRQHCGGFTCDARWEWLPAFIASPLGTRIDWQQFALQTVFLAALFAVLVNLRKSWRRSRELSPMQKTETRNEDR
jgi:hypothetical protein